MVDISVCESKISVKLYSTEKNTVIKMIDKMFLTNRETIDFDTVNLSDLFWLSVLLMPDILAVTLL